jgi:uncharacterized protein (TIGR02271 family)
VARESPSDASWLQVELEGGALISVPRALVRRAPDGLYHFQQAFRTSSQQTAGGELVIPVVAEELNVSKRSVERERVRVTSTVSTREEAVDVPLVQEELVVERVPVGRVVDAASEPRQEGATLIVPVYEEVLVVEKRLVLKEEVHITRKRQEERHREQVPLRREDVLIERLPDEGSAPR